MMGLVKSWNMRLVIVNKKESVYLTEKIVWFLDKLPSCQWMSDRRKKFAEHNPQVSSIFQTPSEIALLVDNSGHAQKYMSNPPNPS
jgi:hypothetical protein